MLLVSAVLELPFAPAPWLLPELVIAAPPAPFDPPEPEPDPDPDPLAPVDPLEDPVVPDAATHPPALHVCPLMHGVAVPHVWQPPVFVPVQLTSAPPWHSVAPGSQSSVHAGDPQTPFVQVWPDGHASAADHTVHGASP